jgi:hypothetical protein
MTSPARALAATPATQGSHGPIADWDAAGAAAGWATATVTGGAPSPPLSACGPFGVVGFGVGAVVGGASCWTGSRL